MITDFLAATVVAGDGNTFLKMVAGDGVYDLVERRGEAVRVGGERCVWRGEERDAREREVLLFFIHLNNYLIKK